MSGKITVIIPTLNEEKAISSVIDNLPSEMRGYNVNKVVIDGGSEDNTVEVAEKAGAEVLMQRTRGGKGSAMKEALSRIEKSEIYVFIDGDSTYSPQDLERLVNPIIDNESDMVVGERKKREKGSIRTLNKVGNKLFNFMVSKFYGKDIKDMLSGFRAMNRKLALNIPMTRKGFGVETEITIEAIERGFRVKEVPIHYRKRKGETKLHPVKDGWMIAKTILWMVRDTRPMSFFGFISFLFFLSGLYPAFLTLQERLSYGRITNLVPPLMVVFCFLFSIQVFLFGMIADQQRSVQLKLEYRLRKRD